MKKGDALCANSNDRLTISLLEESPSKVKISVTANKVTKILELSRPDFREFCESYVLDNTPDPLSAKIISDFNKKSRLM